MSHTSKDQIDLIEDITVEELLADGLVEDVEVSGEEQGKKKLDDKEGTADAPVANAVPTDAPAADAVKPAADAVAAAVSAAPVAMAPHTQGTPEAPALAPEVQKPLPLRTQLLLQLLRQRLHRLKLGSSTQCTNICRQ
jgi:hypothetical protein